MDNGTQTLISARKPLTGLSYDPQPDITAYELSQLIPYIAPFGRLMFEEDWKAIGTAARHIKRTE